MSYSIAPSYAIHGQVGGSDVFGVFASVPLKAIESMLSSSSARRHKRLRPFTADSQYGTASSAIQSGHSTVFRIAIHPVHRCFHDLEVGHHRIYPVMFSLPHYSKLHCHFRVATGMDSRVVMGG